VRGGSPGERVRHRERGPTFSLLKWRKRRINLHGGKIKGDATDYYLVSTVSEKVRVRSFLKKNWGGLAL